MKSTAAPPLALRLLMTTALLLVGAYALHRAYAELLLRWLEQEVALAEVGARSGQEMNADAVSKLLEETNVSAGAMAYELRARALSILARQTVISAERANRYRAARDQLRAAAALRPSSPYVWAELAEVKARAGSVDSEFADSFRRALALGPQEPRVLRQLLSLVLREPERVGATLEREVTAIVQNLGYLEPARLFELASRYHRAGWLCTQANLNLDTIRICAQRGFYPSSGPTP